MTHSITFTFDDASSETAHVLMAVYDIMDGDGDVAISTVDSIPYLLERIAEASDAIYTSHAYDNYESSIAMAQEIINAFNQTRAERVAMSEQYANEHPDGPQ